MLYKIADTNIPEFIKRLFWDCDSSSISISSHKDFITRRIIENGDLDDVV